MIFAKIARLNFEEIILGKPHKNSQELLTIKFVLQQSVQLKFLLTIFASVFLTYTVKMIDFNQIPNTTRLTEGKKISN